jgi:hypothetical protein
VSDPFANAVASIFAALGRDAEYEGQEEDADCRVIVSHDLTQWGDVIQVQNNMAMISVQRAQVAERPRRGDIFRLATGQEYNVERVMRSDEYEHRVLVTEADQ